MKKLTHILYCITLLTGCLLAGAALALIAYSAFGWPAAAPLCIAAIFTLLHIVGHAALDKAGASGSPIKTYQPNSSGVSAK